MDKEALFKQRLTEHEHEIEGLGTVKYRPLSREEALKAHGLTKDVAAMERFLIAKAMVDPGPLTEDDVAKWQAASPAGELQKLADAITTASGMELKSGKDATKSSVGE